MLSALKTRMDSSDTVSEISEEEISYPSRQQATIVGTDQKTIHAVNEVMLKPFAIDQELPIVAWRLPMVDKYAKKFGNNVDFMYDIVKDMTSCFVFVSNDLVASLATSDRRKYCQMALKDAYTAVFCIPMKCKVERKKSVMHILVM